MLKGVLDVEAQCPSGGEFHSARHHRLDVAERYEREGRGLDVDILTLEIIDAQRDVLARYGQAMTRNWVRTTVLRVLRHLDADVSDDAPMMQIPLEGIPKLPRWTSFLHEGHLIRMPTRVCSHPQIRLHLIILDKNIDRASGVREHYRRADRLMAERHRADL